jgi:lipoyl(octanoyl) transferase
MGPLRLRHLHLPSIHPHYVPYSLASRVQEHLRRQHLDFKDSSPATPPSPPPPPTLISFTPAPIYTLGRRQTAPLTPAELARLTAPLRIPDPSKPKTNTEDQTSHVFTPKVLHSPRGGLTTYHGPGQVVFWPVLDIKSPQHKHFTVKCYARLLESTTIATLRSLWGIAAATTDDPGVWVRSTSLTSPPQTPNGDSKEGQGENLAKIAALGVHLRRHVTSLGTALNLAMPSAEVVDEAVNPWARIVACGLAGRAVTSVAGEAGGSALLGERGEEDVAGAWAGQLAGGLGLGNEGGVEVVGVGEVVGLMERLVGEGGGDGDGVRDEVVAGEEKRYVERMKELYQV